MEQKQEKSDNVDVEKLETKKLEVEKPSINESKLGTQKMRMEGIISFVRYSIFRWN